MSLSLQVVADNLSNEQIDSIIEMFRMMDTDENGDLSFEELRDGLPKIGHYVADPDVQMLMEAVSSIHFKIHFLQGFASNWMPLVPSFLWLSEFRFSTSICSFTKDIFFIKLHLP